MRTPGLTSTLILTLMAGCGVSRGAAPGVAAPLEGHLQARTAFLTQEVEGPEHATKHREGVRALTQEVGGMVLGEEQATLHLRVPEPRLVEVMSRLEKLAPITESALQAPEVTGVVQDLQIRVDSGRALRARLLALLEKAQTVEELLAVERELGRINEGLALAEAQLGAESGKVAFADVNITVEDPPTPGPVGWVFYGLYQGVKWLFVWD
jgi:hypothetical protein